MKAVFTEKGNVAIGLATIIKNGPYTVKVLQPSRNPVAMQDIIDALKASPIYGMRAYLYDLLPPREADKMFSILPNGELEYR